MMNNENILTAQIMQDHDIIYHDDYLLDESDFKDAQNRLILNTIKECLHDNLNIDLITLKRKNNNIEASRLAQYKDIPTTGNWKYYHDLVYEDLNKSKLKNLANHITDSLKQEKDIKDILKHIDDSLADIGKINQKSKILDIKEMMTDYITKIEDKYTRIQKGEDFLTGIRTGYKQLDELMLGLQKDHFIIIGARPSTGKTAIMLNIASHIAFKEKKKVGFISTESSSFQMISRVVSSSANVDNKKIQMGMTDKKTMDNIMNLSVNICDKDFYMYDSPNAKLGEVKLICKRLVDVYNVDVIFIDYLQNIQNENKKIPKHEQVEEISRDLKQVNRQLKIPIVCAAQLTRDTQNREPELNSFRYSGQIEQDADDVIFIHHDINKEDDGTEIIKSWLLVKKGRDTGTGNVPVTFIKKYIKFAERADN